MDIKKVFSHSRLFKYIMWGTSLIVIFFIAYNFPVAGDDWYAVRVNITSLKELIENAASHWSTVNGRYLGHLMVIICMQSKILCAIIRALIIWLIMILSCEIIKGRFKAAYAIIYMYILAVPKEIFSESYSWAAGFFNYVPPVMLILLYLYMLHSRPGKKTVIYQIGKAICALAIGICGQLYAENITIYVLMMSFVIMVYYIKENQERALIPIVYAVGAIIGTCLMFASPAYRTVADGTDTYRTAPQGLMGVVQIARENWGEISRYTIRGNILLLLTVTAVCLILLYKESEAVGGKYIILRIINSGVLTGTIAYFFSSMFLGWDEKIQQYTAFFFLDLFMCILFIVCVLITIIFFVEDNKEKTRSLFFLISAFILVGPLLFVQPIGPRCFYASYILTVIAVLNLGFYLIKRQKRILQRIIIPLYVLAGCVTLYYLYIFTNMAEVEKERDAYIVERMKEGDRVIVVPEFPYSDYLHEPHSQKIGLEYYYKDVRDIEFDFVPYSQWKNTVSGNGYDVE